MAYSLRHAAILGVAVATLTGCGAPGLSVQADTQPSTEARSASALIQPGKQLVAWQPSTFQAKEAAKSSWMVPGAKHQDLLYISDFANNVVDIYTYPKGKLAGSLTGFSGPEGACVDAHGNVWITSQDQNEILEYAHGGTTPIAEITEVNQLLDGCSIDTSTGTLAVDSLCEVRDFDCVEPGSVFVYTNVKEPPTQFTVSGVEYVYFCGYDSSGDLFVDGEQSQTGPFQLAELPQGSSAFTDISLNRIIYYPGGVQWDGKYVAVGDQEAGDKFTSSVHQISLTGSAGAIVSTTRLEGTGDVTQFWIQGSRIVAPNIGEGHTSDVRIFKYPSGGAPLDIITGQSEPIGATVSLAQDETRPNKTQRDNESTMP
jgi:hypothetical protein